MGRREEALGPIQEAVAIRRALAEAAPDAYLPDLAGSLTTLGIRFTELQRYQDALVADREAVRLYVHLQAKNPRRFSEAAQNALRNLTIDLRALGSTGMDIERELEQLLAPDETQ